MDAAPPTLDLRRYAEEALRRGLYVQEPGGRRVPIAPAAEPTVHDLSEESAAAAVLVRAAARAADRLGLDDLGALTPFERASLAARRERGAPLRLATARVDFIGGKVLELNATIPAMQGYSDVLVEALVAACGAPAGLVDDNGRNTDDLLDALLELAPGARRIGVLARGGDSQEGELRHYQSRFAARGVGVVRLTPADLHLGGDGHLRVEGGPVDLIYRHIFSWRMEPQSDIARAFLRAERHGIVNPIALDIEAKATLAELSRGADAGEPWLAPAERDLVRRLVPWTRRLDAEMAALALAEQARFVIKRSWDYGGRSVHIGVETPAPQWASLLAEAQRPGDVWVLQEWVKVEASPRTLLDQDGVGVRGPTYADLCAYATLGLATQARGGASRVAPRRVVNLMGGGGLAPLLRPGVARALGLGV